VKEYGSHLDGIHVIERLHHIFEIPVLCVWSRVVSKTYSEGKARGAHDYLRFFGFFFALLTRGSGRVFNSVRSTSSGLGVFSRLGSFMVFRLFRKSGARLTTFNFGSGLETHTDLARTLEPRCTESYYHSRARTRLVSRGRANVCFGSKADFPVNSASS
jgi:hypothetical protein